MYDLLIRNGTLIDPSQSIEGPRDVAVADGRVAAVDDRLEVSSATTVLDAAGKLVTPGLIDLHVHAYWGGTPSSVDPDATCLAKGVALNQFNIDLDFLFIQLGSPRSLMYWHIKLKHATNLQSNTACVYLPFTLLI